MLIIPVTYEDKGFDRYLGESFADSKNQAYFDELLFDDGLRFYRIENDTITLDRVSAFSAVDSFSDSESYMNPMLQFGSANIPNEGLNFQLALPDASAPTEAEVKVYFTWER